MDRYKNIKEILLRYNDTVQLKKLEDIKKQFESELEIE